MHSKAVGPETQLRVEIIFLKSLKVHQVIHLSFVSAIILV